MLAYGKTKVRVCIRSWKSPISENDAAAVRKFSRSLTSSTVRASDSALTITKWGDLASIQVSSHKLPARARGEQMRTIKQKHDEYDSNDRHVRDLVNARVVERRFEKAFPRIVIRLK